MFACGKKEVKPVSEESKSSIEAFALTEKIKTAFINKDLTAIQAVSTEDGYRDATTNRKPFDSVDLTFTPRWVEIEDSKLFVNVSWKSKWTASGNSTEDRGMAVFVMEGKPLKLSKILRANPFIFPEPPAF
jgi:hypothetical protein